MDILLTESKFILVIFKGININSEKKGNNLKEIWVERSPNHVAPLPPKKSSKSVISLSSRASSASSGASAGATAGGGIIGQI